VVVIGFNGFNSFFYVLAMVVVALGNIIILFVEGSVDPAAALVLGGLKCLLDGRGRGYLRRGRR
jgi:hypothetical protein